jgi:hypothetical protein
MGTRSRIRRNAGIKLKGGPINIGAYLVHFPGQELFEVKRSKLDRFWHTNIHDAGFLLDQDEMGTFTVHNFGPHILQEGVMKYDPQKVVLRVLGGRSANLLRSYAVERKYILLQNLIHATDIVATYTNFAIQYLNCRATDSRSSE